MPDRWEKADESFQEFLLNLVLQSYSPAKIKALTESMKLPYSAAEIEEIKEELYQKAKELRTRELPENLFCLFIDAYHTTVKDEEAGRVRKAVIYVTIGVDLEGRKSFLGYYVYLGSESRKYWLEILNDLIKRGPKKSNAYSE